MHIVADPVVLKGFTFTFQRTIASKSQGRLIIDCEHPHPKQEPMNPTTLFLHVRSKTGADKCMC